MKLESKQKKLIVIIGLLIIGILIFALTRNPSEKSSNNSGKAVSGEETNQQDSSLEQTGEDEDLAEAETEEAKPKFLVNEDPEIVELITKYMNAKLEPSKEAFEPLVDDVSQVDMDLMEKETKVYERYDNITVYSIDLTEFKEGALLVYVYHDTKIIGIDTAAPGANRFLVIKEADKAPYIQLTEVSTETASFIEEFEQGDDYKEFVKKAETNLKAALDKDEILKEFYARLYESVQESQTPTEETADPVEETQAAAETTEATEATEAPPETE